MNNSVAPVEMTLSDVKEKYPSSFGVYSSLPETLPIEEILRANSTNHDTASSRAYCFDEMRFIIPPGVFSPGGTSEAVFKRIIDKKIDVQGKRVLVMGCGAGIETVLIARNGATVICAVDIDEASIAATEHNFRVYTPEDKRNILVAIASDLFASVDGVFDLILFNPPAVSVQISEDPDIIRNTSVGTTILTRFFAEIREKGLLAPRGAVVVIMSNTAELRKIVSCALELGFTPTIRETTTYSEPFEKIKTFAISFGL